MPFMRLNVETVSAVQDRMAKDKIRLAELITALTGAVRGLENGAWLGYSASQFFQEYETLNSEWNLQMGLMQALAERMKQEIDEWEEVASKMG
jgi:uncharacterized protein YukE